MSIKELEDALAKGNVLFGIRECLKGKKDLKAVFISRDARDETVEKLEAAGIEFVVLKNKEELAKQLNLDFESEVFSIK